MTVDDLINLRRFVPSAQMATLFVLSAGEEKAHFIQKMDELSKTIRTMPKTYEQEGLGDGAMVHLHYFSSQGNWYITERDCEAVQHQAYGLADPFGDGGELGYISIAELLQSRSVEIDLYWEPKKLAEIREARQERVAQ